VARVKQRRATIGDRPSGTREGEGEERGRRDRSDPRQFIARDDVAERRYASFEEIRGINHRRLFREQ